MQKTINLFKKHLPPGVEFEIVETDGKLIAKYLFRATYTSKRSGKKMTITSKGDTLPTKVQELSFHLATLYLTEREIITKFAKVRWKLQQARRDAFLFEGKNLRVSENDKDKSPAQWY